MWEKSGSKSKQNASSNAPKVDKDNMLLNVTQNHHDNVLEGKVLKLLEKNDVEVHPDHIEACIG